MRSKKIPTQEHEWEMLIVIFSMYLKPPQFFLSKHTGDYCGQRKKAKGVVILCKDANEPIVSEFQLWSGGTEKYVEREKKLVGLLPGVT